MEKSVKEDTWRCCIKITVDVTKDVGLPNAAFYKFRGCQLRKWENNESTYIKLGTWSI